MVRVVLQRFTAYVLASPDEAISIHTHSKTHGKTHFVPGLLWVSRSVLLAVTHERELTDY
jgi:hypothetical protein